MKRLPKLSVSLKSHSVASFSPVSPDKDSRIDNAKNFDDVENKMEIISRITIREGYIKAIRDSIENENNNMPPDTELESMLLKLKVVTFEVIESIANWSVTLHESVPFFWKGRKIISFSYLFINTNYHRKELFN